MGERPGIRLVETEVFERHVRLRLPFRYGVVTMTEAPHAFVRIRTRDGREGVGMSAEPLAPKWFDKSPALSGVKRATRQDPAARAAGSLPVRLRSSPCGSMVRGRS